MGKDTISPDQNLDNDNIFEDFATDDSLEKEVEFHEEKRKKDAYYYLKLGTSFLKAINALLFIGVGVLFAYSFIQNNTTNREYSFLTPICFLFLGDVSDDINTCYSVSYYLKKSGEDLQDAKESQAKDIASLVGDIYLVDNFIYSKIVTFLITVSKNSLQPTQILSEFDALKNKFEPIDKSKITCVDIVITEPGVLEASCDAYSSDWDSKIPELKDGVLIDSINGGTSISIASSFIDFIENDPLSNFTVLNRQKIFFTSNVTGKGIYTKKTPFRIILQYNKFQTLDF